MININNHDIILTVGKVMRRNRFVLSEYLSGLAMPTQFETIFVRRKK